MIRAAIFDMDGLLVDSEPLWTRAEIEGFGALGIALTPADCAQTVGLALEEVVALRYRQKPWEGAGRAEVAAGIHRRMLELLRTEAHAMPGAREALRFFRERGCRLGLATSSDPALMETALGTLALRGEFDFLQAGEGLTHGKPHPEIYLRCAEALSVPPGDSVALEDSLPGVRSAKAAGMRVIAVPEPRLWRNPGYAVADRVLVTLAQLDEEVWRSLHA